MHDWMLTKEGAFAVGIESVTLIAFSLLANIFKDDDKNVFKRHIAAVWPYCRGLHERPQKCLQGYSKYVAHAGEFSIRRARS